MDTQDLHTVYFSLGTNLGNKHKNLEIAVEMIGKSCGIVVRSSGIYVSKSWGYDSSNDFFNQCLKLDTGLGPEELLQQILEIEHVMGREKQGTGYADRIIDIDILFYDKATFKTDRLHIPHPRIPERLFVLKPMMELDPEFVHPTLQETIAVLLKKCTDSLDVRKL